MFNKLLCVLQFFKTLSVQNYIAVFQSFVAVLMLWSLSLTKQQIDNSKSPILSSHISNNKLYLSNIGGIDVKNISIIAYLAAFYNEKNEKVGRYQMSAGYPEKNIVSKSLCSNKDIALDLKNLTPISNDIPREAEEREAFAVVFRFCRYSDMRPFYKIISFTRAHTQDSSTGQYLYFPHVLLPGCAISGPNTSVSVFKKLRDELRKICIENLDLPTEITNN